MTRCNGSKNGTVTKTYTYNNSDWRDLLTAYNGTAITYDATGNPLSYTNGKYSYTMQWEQGRQLAEAEFEDGRSQYIVNYTYDLEGIRTSKLVNGVMHNYITQNGKVVRETIGTGSLAKVLDFVYDASGKPFALKYKNGTAAVQTYYYVLNLQGDVVALMTASRSIVAQYTYNAWGELLSVTNASGITISSATHIGNLNPLRYRGYYYDTETGFYCLQSRYYDPALHRFINADSYQSTGQGVLGCNMFAYCNNSPIILTDREGNFPGLQGQIENEMVAEGAHGKYIYVFFPAPPFFSYDEPDDTTEIVDDQNAKGIKNIPFGLSNTGHGGCGGVAIHNVIISMDGHSSLRSINRYIAFTGQQQAFGWLGMLPTQVASVLMQKGYSVVMTSDPEMINTLSKCADGCILWYAFETSSFPYVGAHFTMYERISGGYLFHNVGGVGTEFSVDPYAFGTRDTRFGTTGIFVFNN